MLTPSSPYLCRGVYRAPCLSPEGHAVYFAVDSQHRLVEGTRTELEPCADPSVVLAALWRMLDDADPENSRRTKIREAARRAAGRLAGMIAAGIVLTQVADPIVPTMIF